MGTQRETLLGRRSSRRTLTPFVNRRTRSMERFDRPVMRSGFAFMSFSRNARKGRHNGIRFVRLRSLAIALVFPIDIIIRSTPQSIHDGLGRGRAPPAEARHPAARVGYWIGTPHKQLALGCRRHALPRDL